MAATLHQAAATGAVVVARIAAVGSIPAEAVAAHIVTVAAGHIGAAGSIPEALVAAHIVAVEGTAVDGTDTAAVHKAAAVAEYTGKLVLAADDNQVEERSSHSVPAAVVVVAAAGVLGAVVAAGSVTAAAVAVGAVTVTVMPLVPPQAWEKSAGSPVQQL